jgi:hypothetical protein
MPLAAARNVTRTLDGVRVTVKSADASRAELSVSRDGRSDAEWYAVRAQLTAGQGRLLNDQGQVVARSPAGGVNADEGPENQKLELQLRLVKESPDGGGREARDAQRKSASEATRFVWEFPVDARELVVPFEFRGLPIP